MNLELTREDFWNYIKDARIKYKNNDSKVIDYLTEKLKEKTLEEIFSWLREMFFKSISTCSGSGQWAAR